MSDEGRRGPLTRKTKGLTPAHTALIAMLAEIAVADYLAELAEEDEK
jgi:hypothetical protein